MDSTLLSSIDRSKEKGWQRKKMEKEEDGGRRVRGQDRTRLRGWDSDGCVGSSWKGLGKDLDLGMNKVEP